MGMVCYGGDTQICARLNLINHVFDVDADHGAVGVTALLHKGRIVLMADTLRMNGWMRKIWQISPNVPRVARHLGLEPRVAFVSFSTFGYPVSGRAEKIHCPTGFGQARR